MSEVNTKKIEIELDGAWVLTHRDDEQLPVAALETELSKDKTLKISGTSLTSLTVTYTGAEGDWSGFKDAVIKILKSRYPDATEDIVSFRILSADAADESDGKTESQTKDESLDGSAEQSERRRGLFSRFFETSDTDGDDGKNKDGGDAAAKIDALVGAVEFKSLAREIAGVAPEIRRTETYDVFTNQCYLFSIGDGCGLTTYLKLFAGLISDLRLAKISSSPVREESLGAYRESMEPFEAACRALSGGSEKNVKVVCVDISEWMDKVGNHYFRQFLRVVEKSSEGCIVVFRIPFVDKDILARTRFALSDLLSVRAVSFPPLNQREIKIYAEEQLKKYDFTITRPSWKYFFDRISEEKSDGKFYGINTVKKVIRELVYQKHVSNSRRGKSDNRITADDAKALCAGGGDGNLSGMEQLNRLVGVEGVKKRVEEIIAQIELSLKEESGQMPCVHMRFVGNPGTGKTTVARIIGKILKERGVLRVGAFFEYAGRDFCGRYIGETAPKTASICRDAYGSVLFIDEAYSLYRGDGDTKDFGREAIDTLIAEMENHRSDFVVIMAGYTGDMEKLMGGNQGLASRMPYVIEFPNFTREQLYDIFVSMAKGKFKCGDGLFEAAREFFLNLPEETLSAKEFSNARFVRNLFERTWAKAAMRCQLSGKTDVVLTRDDFEHASADKEFAANNSKKARIGF